MPEAKLRSDFREQVRPWRVLSTEEVFSDTPWVRVYKDSVKLPSGRIIDNYYRVDLPDYAMVYALRNDGKVLFEKQYKHSLGRVSWALPTGCIEQEEKPLAAAKRELLEETGYVARTWKFIGAYLVDGSRGCGKAHFFMAEDIEKVTEPVNDDTEECEIEFLGSAEIKEFYLNGKISLLATIALLSIAGDINFKNK